MSGWWDDSLYAGSAEYYAVGRLPYPQRLAEVLCERLDPERRGRLLDLGCGPGSLTLLLARLFGECVAADADADMLRVGRARAAELNIVNVTWVQCRAESLGNELGAFDAVTLAQSFHWMDQPNVAGRILRLLEPDGVCVHVGATTHEGVAGATGLPHPAPPREEIAELIRRYLGPQRRAGQRTVPADLSGDEDAVFSAAGFRGPERIEVEAGQVFERTEDEIVASVHSLSFAAPHLFGPQLAAFDADLRSLLRSVAADGMFAEKQRDITLSLWRG